MNNRLRQRLPLLTTAAIFLALFITTGCFYNAFFSARVAVNLFADNAFLGITAVGMTLVIFTGGIDLSVGAVIGFTSIFTATMINSHGMHPALAALLALMIGSALGTFMGVLIQKFKLPAFLITLAGMFLARGGAYWISTESIGIRHPLYSRLSEYGLELGFVRVPITALIFIGVMIVGYLVAHFTRLGRNLLAIGGSEQSSLLMGLPVASSTVLAYTINGFCAALAGLVSTLYTGSGNAAHGMGLELDAIAVVVIGGTLLTGGRGHMLGTLFGLLVYGTIQQAILFNGSLDPAWARITVGLLLLGFILLQKVFTRRAASS